MTNADWRARVVQARRHHDGLLPQRVWTLRKSGHEAAIHLRAVRGGFASHSRMHGKGRV